jgi:hypothetical protein
VNNVLRFLFWVGGTWLQLSLALILFASLLVLVGGPFIVHATPQFKGDPWSFYSENIAKIFGLASFTASLWVHHYWPRILRAKGIESAFRSIWANYFLACLVVSALFFMFAFAMNELLAANPERSPTLGELISGVVTLFTFGFLILTVVPRLRSHAPILFGSDSWLLDRLFLSEAEISKLQ